MIYTGNVVGQNCRKRGKKNIPGNYHGMFYIPGGWGGIRTPGRVAPSAVFKTVAFDRSATHPKLFHFIRRSFKPAVLFAPRCGLTIRSRSAAFRLPC